jgi:hypothetical protein
VQLAARAGQEDPQRRARGEVLDVRAQPLVAQHRLVARPARERRVPLLLERQERLAALHEVDLERLVRSVPGLRPAGLGSRPLHLDAALVLLELSSGGHGRSFG